MIALDPWQKWSVPFSSFFPSSFPSFSTLGWVPPRLSGLENIQLLHQAPYNSSVHKKKVPVAVAVFLQLTGLGSPRLISAIKDWGKTSSKVLCFFCTSICQWTIFINEEVFFGHPLATDILNKLPRFLAQQKLVEEIPKSLKRQSLSAAQGPL